MAEPYVQFLFNFTTKQPLGEPVFAPGGPTPGALSWQITSDAAGKVVVRDHAGTVIGTGAWQFNKTADRTRGRDAKRLDDARWNEIDSLLYAYLEQSRARGATDPSALDPGTVANPISVEPLKPDQPVEAAPAPAPQVAAAPPEKQGLISKIFYSILGIIALVVIGVGIYFWETKIDKKLANGASCTLDAECASKRCSGSTCRAVHNRSLGNGSTCESASECASGRCSSGDVCY